MSPIGSQEHYLQEKEETIRHEFPRNDPAKKISRKESNSKKDKSKEVIERRVDGCQLIPIAEWKQRNPTKTTAETTNTNAM